MLERIAVLKWKVLWLLTVNFPIGQVMIWRLKKLIGTGWGFI